MRNVFAKSLLAAAVAGTAMMGAAGTASADVSASVSAASMYLWRGQNLTPDGAMVSGSIDYSHESGFYAGVWTSTESDGHETDLYLGFAGEVAGFGYDVAYFYYMYPEELDPGTGNQAGISDSSYADVFVGLSYGPVFANFYQQVDAPEWVDTYYQVGFSYDKFSVFYGAWDREFDIPDYSHIQLDFAATDELSFSVSKASADNEVVEEDPLFMVSYSLSFDL